MTDLWTLQWIGTVLAEDWRADPDATARDAEAALTREARARGVTWAGTSRVHVDPVPQLPGPTLLVIATVPVRFKQTAIA